MAASQGKSATAVVDAVYVAARREVRQLEVHWRGGRRQTTGVAACQDAMEAAGEEVPAAVAGAA